MWISGVLKDKNTKILVYGLAETFFPGKRHKMLVIFPPLRGHKLTLEHKSKKYF